MLQMINEIEEFFKDSFPWSWQSWFVDPVLRENTKKYLAEDYKLFEETWFSQENEDSWKKLQLFLKSKFPRMRLWLQTPQLWEQLCDKIQEDFKKYLEKNGL